MARLADLGIIVTGGAGGLGEAISRRLLSEGARVVIADIDAAAGEAMAEELGAGASFVELDVRDPESWAATGRLAVEQVGEVGGLVNNAAVFWMGRLLDMPADRMSTMYDVNLLGPSLGIQAIAPIMASTGGGSIVNISSIDGTKGMNSVAAYNASKWGLRGLTKGAAIELGRDGIRVNAVCPSTGGSNFVAPFYEHMDISRMVGMRGSVLADDGKTRDVTLGDVAAMVAFLMSDDSATCTGSDFVVDGGWTAGDNVPGLPGF